MSHFVQVAGNGLNGAQKLLYLECRGYSEVVSGCTKIRACKATVSQTEAAVVWGILQVKTHHKLQTLKVPLLIWKDLEALANLCVCTLGGRGAMDSKAFLGKELRVTLFPP